MGHDDLRAATGLATEDSTVAREATGGHIEISAAGPLGFQVTAVTSDNQRTDVGTFSTLGSGGVREQHARWAPALPPDRQPKASADGDKRLFLPRARAMLRS